ncbi:putative protein (DUF736 domain) [Campylobacter pinnipediorum subsp. caledonicus]|uniref:DUF736 domain protein n=1 Tax=Campylobacter pinnipediorum subsp. caledonicus TaxID=1874362 RepID=A0A1S6U600_9BACT|nr:DUF736 family protein [Campylobacter pinnipediorum]AQW87122.1 putative protein (DUF736 domain) [Campylobacter pinnipediorum subsp. caledonicus]
MNIGYFKNVIYTNEQGQELSYIGGIINIPFARPLEVALLKASAEDKKNNANLPDFKIVLQRPKGYQGQRQIIGALWKRQSQRGLEYISGSIQSPILPGGQMYIALFEPTQDDSQLLYEISWSVPKSNNTQSSIPDVNTDDIAYEINNEIPF